MAGTTVCLFRSTDTGAPSLTGTSGSLVAVLDACLQDGYNSKTIQSITRSSATATVTFANAHNFTADGLTKVQISGCDQSEYNGIHIPTNISTNAFDFTVSGTPASGSGTMIAKVAPLGWSKTYSGTNKAVYRGNEVTGTRLYLRVDDTNAQYGLWRGYETMSDVDTGTGLFPTVAQMANGVYCSKSSTSDATARPWVLMGDGYEFLLFSTTSNSYSGVYAGYHFGDTASEMLSDPFGCLIFGGSGNQANNTPESFSNTHSINAGITWTAQNNTYYARSYTQTGTSVGACKLGNLWSGQNIIGGQIGAMPYPATHNNGLYVAPIFAGDGASFPRAQIKCMYQPLHYHPLGHGGFVSAANSPIGRRLYAVATAYSSSTPGETHIDIDGPWR